MLKGSTDFEHYAILGFPEYLREVESVRPNAETLTINVRHAVEFVTIEKIEPDDPVLEKIDWPADFEMPQFFGKLRHPLEVHPTIRGMSGGPIIGFCVREGKEYYYPIAIQSAWSKKYRIIRGLSLHEAMAAFEEFLADKYGEIL